MKRRIKHVPVFSKVDGRKRDAERVWTEHYAPRADTVENGRYVIVRYGKKLGEVVREKDWRWRYDDGDGRCGFATTRRAAAAALEEATT